MGHLQKIEADLRDMLSENATPDELAKWVKDVVLESYRNGLASRKPSAEERPPRQRKAARA